MAEFALVLTTVLLKTKLGNNQKMAEFAIVLTTVLFATKLIKKDCQPLLTYHCWMQLISQSNQYVFTLS